MSQFCVEDLLRVGILKNLVQITHLYLQGKISPLGH